MSEQERKDWAEGLVAALEAEIHDNRVGIGWKECDPDVTGDIHRALVAICLEKLPASAAAGEPARKSKSR